VDQNLQGICSPIGGLTCLSNVGQTCAHSKGPIIVAPCTLTPKGRKFSRVSVGDAIKSPPVFKFDAIRPKLSRVSRTEGSAKRGKYITCTDKQKKGELVRQTWASEKLRVAIMKYAS
jgi:hypothetical protein